MFFKQCKALFAPVVIMIVIVFLFGTTWAPFGPSKEGVFAVNTLLGALLGCALALLPLLYGAARERFATQRWFACAIMLLVLLYQYASEFLGADVPWLAWLRIAHEHSRALFAEGCLIGFCAMGALRARR